MSVPFNAPNGTARWLTTDEISDIHHRHPILDVLERAGLALDTHGGGSRDVMISCPRPGHDDSTPSCVIHPASGRFYCFGCGAQGDVFGLVTELTGVTSLAKIAELLDSGAAIAPSFRSWRSPVVVSHARPTWSRPLPDRTGPARVMECNQAAWTFLTCSRLADRARLFLARRGIDAWPIERETGQPVAGHTPSDRAALSAHLQRCGFTTDEITDAGWALHRPGDLSDRFQGRVLFAVRDAQARILGVIGRDVTGQARQKYLNTSATVAFSKGSTLFRPECTPAPDDPTVIVCEGPVDALAIASAAAALGVADVVPVAPSGTALTTEQVRLVLRITDRAPILCADGDEAGRAAAANWSGRFEQAGRSTRTVALPDGEDPASWLSRHGPAAFSALLGVGGIARPSPSAPAQPEAIPHRAGHSIVL